MINWLVAFFILCSITLSSFFDIFLMLTINLPIIAATRGLYILGYYLNYIKFSERDPDDTNSYVFSRKEKIYFAAKNVAVILLGFMHLCIALFLGIYSVLIASVYFKNIGSRRENKRLEKIGDKIYKLAPVGFIVAFLIFLDFIAIAAIVIGFILFLNWGQKYGDLSLKELSERYERRIFRRINAPIQYAILILFIVPGIVLIIIIIGLYIGHFQFVEDLAIFYFYLFNVDIMLAVNFPIIIAARGLYMAAYYFKYVKFGTPESKNDKSTIFSKTQKRYFLATNIIIIILGVLFIYVALFAAVYSLLIAAIYFNNIGKQKNDKKYIALRFISYGLIPTFITLAIIFYFDVFGWIPIAIAAGLAIPLFYYKFQKYGVLSLKPFLENFENKFRKVPNTLKYFLIGYLIVVPMFFIVGISMCSPPPKETYMVKMSDGTKLATDVYYSPLAWDAWEKKPLPAPVILVRTPYNKEAFAMDYYSMLYLAQGYHVVFQDFRNCFASEGDKSDVIFTQAYTDGVDTINWILDQDWCNGKIGSMGASALAINQYFYAGMGPDGLKCQSLWFGTPSFYEDLILEGCFHQHLITNWLEGVAPKNWRYQIDKLYDIINTKDINAPEYRQTTLNAAPNNWSNVKVAGLHVGGWYDLILSGTLRGYRGYDDNGTKDARGKQALIVGPWIHGMVIGGVQGALNYPVSSNGVALLFKWETKIFDEALLGMKNDLWEGNRVAYYLMGDVDDPTVDANKWKFTDDWPLDYKWKEWYFGKDDNDKLVLVDDDNNLDGFNNLSYLYDPRDPCPTIGGNNLGSMNGYAPGPQDQRQIESRDDVLVFTSEVLKKPYTIEGDIKVRLFFSSNCTDTDFMVRLTDVYPDGRSMLIIDGARMARLRWNMYEDHLLDSPIKEYNMTINLCATAYQFNTGHRIRISISSSNHPRFAINPNTGGNIEDHFAEGYIANNTIITGPGKSHILFPEL